MKAQIFLLLCIICISCTTNKEPAPTGKKDNQATKIVDEYEQETGLKIEKRMEIYKHLAKLQEKIPDDSDPQEFERTYALTAKFFNVKIDVVRIIAVEGSKKLWPME